MASSGLGQVTERQSENMGIAIAVILMFVVLIIAAQTELDEDTYAESNPSVICAEDENWVPTHYLNPDGVEDAAGVTRWCLHPDTENWVPTR